jgi:hypothetical protein
MSISASWQLGGEEDEGTSGPEKQLLWDAACEIRDPS